MKTLEFKKFERATDSATTLENLGTVNAQAGVGGSYRPASTTNFLDKTKRVAIVIVNKAGESVVVSCSQAISDGLRNKSIALSQLGALSILSTEDGKLFISKNGGNLPSIKVEAVEAEDTVSASSLEGLIAW